MARPEEQKPYSVQGPDAAAVKRFNRGGSGDGSPQKAYSVAGADPAAMKRFNAAGSGQRTPIAGGRSARRVGGGMLKQGPKLGVMGTEFARLQGIAHKRRDKVLASEQAHEKDLYRMRFGDNQQATGKAGGFGKGGAGAAGAGDRRSELLASINEMTAQGGTYADQFGTGKITTSDGRVVGGRFKRKLSDMNDSDLMSVQAELAGNLGDKKTAAAGLAGAKKALETRAGVLKQIVSATPKEITEGLEKVPNPAWQKANSEYLSILDKIANGDKPAPGARGGGAKDGVGVYSGTDYNVYIPDDPAAELTAGHAPGAGLSPLETSGVGAATEQPFSGTEGSEGGDTGQGTVASVPPEPSRTMQMYENNPQPAGSPRTSVAQNAANDFIFDNVLPGWMNAVETGYKTIGNLASKHPTVKGLKAMGGRLASDAGNTQQAVQDDRARKRSVLSSL